MSEAKKPAAAPPKAAPAPSKPAPVAETKNEQLPAPAPAPAPAKPSTSPEEKAMLVAAEVEKLQAEKTELVETTSFLEGAGKKVSQFMLDRIKEIDTKIDRLQKDKKYEAGKAKMYELAEQFRAIAMEEGQTLTVHIGGTKNLAPGSHATVEIKLTGHTVRSASSIKTGEPKTTNVGVGKKVIVDGVEYSSSSAAVKALVALGVITQAEYDRVHTNTDGTAKSINDANTLKTYRATGIITQFDRITEMTEA